MPIDLPGKFGVILRKNARTADFIHQHKARLREFYPELPDGQFNEDDHIIGISVAMNGMDLQRTVDKLIVAGAIHGADFVATSSSEGVLDPMPDWLVETRGPTGNPAELEARMDPEVRAMWEAVRPTVYSFRSS